MQRIHAPHLNRLGKRVGLSAFCFKILPRWEFNNLFGSIFRMNCLKIKKSVAIAAVTEKILQNIYEPHVSDRLLMIGIRIKIKWTILLKPTMQYHDQPKQKNISVDCIYFQINPQSKRIKKIYSCVHLLIDCDLVISMTYGSNGANLGKKCQRKLTLF